jgi:uncharacterized protein YjbJ (UPF0337 family)
MSNATKRAEGAGKELLGKVKKNVGRLVGRKRMEAAGRAEELQGRAKKESAKSRERIKGRLEEVEGKVQGAVGDLFDDTETEVRGKLRKAKGKARQAVNR